MGLRHRTAMSALREQRRCAEQGHQQHPAKGLPSFPRKAIHSRPAEGEKTDHTTWSVVGSFATLPSSERCHKMLSRLRQSLKPQNDVERRAHRETESEYRSLQDELLRLSQHKAEGRRIETDEEALRELLIPRSYQNSEAMEDLPFRRLRVLPASESLAQTPAPAIIIRLESSLSDLSFYHQAHVSAPTLSLVHNADRPCDAADILLAEPRSEREMSAEAANLIQQNLQPKASRTAIAIPHDVILSLLDT